MGPLAHYMAHDFFISNPPLDCTLELGNGASNQFSSGYVPTSWEMLEYIDKSPTPFIYGNIIIKQIVPKIPLIPPPPLSITRHAHARYKHVQNTPLLRTTEPNLFQT